MEKKMQALTSIGCISFSTFASVVGIPVRISRSAVGLKIFVIITEIKRYMSLIKTKRKNMKK